VGIVLAAGLVSAPPVADARPAGQATAPAGAAAASDPTRLRIGSYNIRAGVDLADFKRGIDALKPEVDVAGLQEIGSNDRNKYLRSDHDWGYYRPVQLQQNPVIWDRSLFDFLGARGYKIAEKRDLHGEHTGDEAKGDSYATVVRLRHRPSGQRISFVNVHLVRGAVKGGRPAKGKPHLFELYVDQVAGLIRAVKEERDHADRVYALGDFNVGYKADAKWRNKKLPFRKFKAIGYRSMWKQSPYLRKSFGTHNDALIDQVWNPADSVDETILRRITVSDHRPAVATYRMPAPPAGYQPAEGTVGFGDIKLAPNGNRPGDTENDGPSKIPSIFVRFQGDLSHGYAEVRVEENPARLSADGNPPGDFAVDTSTLFDNDFTNNEVAVDLVADDQCEPSESFTLRLVNPVNTRIIESASSVQVTIKDDDC
jgi:hypothetical protein